MTEDRGITNDRDGSGQIGACFYRYVPSKSRRRGCIRQEYFAIHKISSYLPYGECFERWRCRHRHREITCRISEPSEPSLWQFLPADSSRPPLI
jgi:hypothetical protein